MLGCTSVPCHFLPPLLLPRTRIPWKTTSNDNVHSSPERQWTWWSIITLITSESRGHFRPRESPSSLLLLGAISLSPCHVKFLTNISGLGSSWLSTWRCSNLGLRLHHKVGFAMAISTSPGQGMILHCNAPRLLPWRGSTALERNSGKTGDGQG